MTHERSVVIDNGFTLPKCLFGSRIGKINIG